MIAPGISVPVHLKKIMDASLITYLGDKRYPRSTRNNNPGNLVRSAIAWQGKIPHSQNTDKRFEQFSKLWYGVRALIKDLKTDYFKKGKKTVLSLISEFAPPNENNTNAYIDRVSYKLNVTPDQEIQWNFDTVYELVQAIGRYEAGQDPKITPEIFNLAWMSVHKK